MGWLPLNLFDNVQRCAIPIPELELESEFQGFSGAMELESELNRRLKSHGGIGIGTELKVKLQDGIGIGMELNPYGIGIDQFQPFSYSEVKTLHQRQAWKPGVRAVVLGKGANVGMPIYSLSNTCPHLSLWLFRSKDVSSVMNVSRRQRFAPLVIISFGHVSKHDYHSVGYIFLSWILDL